VRGLDLRSVSKWLRVRYARVVSHDVQPEQTMQVQLDPLITIISVRRRSRMLRRELARRHRSYSHADKEEACIDMLFEWLGASCDMYFSPQDDTEPAEEYMQHDLFTLAVIYLEGLVTIWTEKPPTRDQEDCLRTIVALLSTLASKKNQPRMEIKNELIASFMLSSGLWNYERGQALIGPAVTDMDVTAKSDLFALVKDQTELAALVKVVREWALTALSAVKPG